MERQQMSKKEFSEFNARYPSSTGSYQGAPGLARSISRGNWSVKVPLHHIGRLHYESLFFLYFCFGNAIGNDRRLKLKTIEGRGIHFV